MNIPEYQSSEGLQLQLHRAEVFAVDEKEKTQHLTEKDKLYRLLDKYIDKHSKTTSVRAMTKDNKKVEKYGADYQLDLSADIVETLEKIKNELR